MTTEKHKHQAVACDTEASHVGKVRKHGSYHPVEETPDSNDRLSSRSSCVCWNSSTDWKVGPTGSHRWCRRRVISNRAATVRERCSQVKPDRFLTVAAL